MLNYHKIILLFTTFYLFFASFDGKSYIFAIFSHFFKYFHFPVSVKKQLGSGFRGLLDPDGGFWLDPGSMNVLVRSGFDEYRYVLSETLGTGTHVGIKLLRSGEKVAQSTNPG